MILLGLLLGVGAFALSFYFGFTGLSLLLREGYAENYVDRQFHGNFWRWILGNETKVLPAVKYVNGSVMSILSLILLIASILFLLYAFLA